MKCILICSIAAICATVVQGASVLVNETELQIKGIQKIILSDIDSLKNFVNNTLEPSNYKIQSSAAESITNVSTESFDKLQHESEKYEKGNEKVANCFDNAKRSGAAEALRAVHDVAPCVVRYLDVYDEVIKNISRVIKLHEMYYNWTTLSLSTPCEEKEGKPEDCSRNRLSILERAYYTILTLESEFVQASAYQTEHSAAEVVNDCIDKHIATLRTKLQKLQSEYTACTSAS